MKSLNVEEIMPYSQEQMFSLVCDIESYPEFIDLIKKAEMIRKYEDGGEIWKLTCHWYGISFTFSTQNTYLGQKQIIMRMHEGPMSDLHGQWAFIFIDHRQTKVSLKIDFEILSLMPWMNLESHLNQVSYRILKAFKERAKTLYG